MPNITKIVTTVGDEDVSTAIVSNHWETVVFYADGSSTLRPRWSFSLDEAMKTHAEFVDELTSAAALTSDDALEELRRRLDVRHTHRWA